MDLEQQTAEQIKQVYLGGNLPKALQLAQQNLQTWPRNLTLLKVQAYCFFQMGRLKEATVCFHELEQLEPNDPNTFANLGHCYLSLKYYDRAARNYIKALLKQFNAEWAVNLGNCYSALGLYELAILTLQRASQSGLKDENLAPNFVHNLIKAGRLNHALSVTNALPQGELRSLFKAEILAALNQPERTEAVLAQELEGKSLAVPTLQRLHNVYRHLGNKEKEIAVVEELLTRDPNSSMLAKCMLAAEGKLDAKEVEAELEQYAQDDLSQSTCYFILAKAFKKTDPQHWFALTQKANQLQNPQKTNLSIHKTSFEEAKSAVRDIAPISATDAKVSEEKGFAPVFILGMPRSGTTLVETLLGNHSKVFAAGETPLMDALTAAIHGTVPEVIHGHAMRTRYLQEKAKLIEENVGVFAHNYLDSLAQFKQHETHITDKTPHNFLHLGMILKAFPHAKIIHCKRDPISNCISIFEQNFSQFHDYGRDLEALGEYYLMYDELMRFFKQQDSQNQILDVQYEALVAEPNKGMETILSHLSLEPEDVLNQPTRRTILTSSNEQATQGVYDSSVNRLEGLEDAFSPLVDKLKSLYH
ncbi:tetratricopeptide repeat-containing sulfotransferase family protein [Alteromonas sp. a30]|uniref:tetratricopeptide repeat-containing sulfotransferase family protein n=1 Tax=Alteromonas sp. a30 TaxID=2730917 RepID=UPI00228258BF|nr:sulfotransferase [Alteromonas sp. a30]MCY7295891.1 tetratricopeptide repeat protein [Alteromonas sp. a30]